MITPAARLLRVNKAAHEHNTSIQFVFDSLTTEAPQDRAPADDDSADSALIIIAALRLTFKQTFYYRQPLYYTMTFKDTHP